MKKALWIVIALLFMGLLSDAEAAPRRQIRQVLRDQFGNTLASATCHVEVSTDKGSTWADASVYSTLAGAVAATGSNLTADSTGVCTGFLDDFDYNFTSTQFRVTASKTGYTTQTYSNILVGPQIGGTYTYAAAQTPTTALDIPYGVTITHTTYTLTFSKPIQAGKYQIFSGTGVITYAAGQGEIYPEWYGAVPGSVGAAQRTINTTAINKAIADAWQSNVQASSAKVSVLLSSWYETDGSIVIKGGYNRLVGTGSETSGIINNSLTAHHITITPDGANVAKFITIEKLGIKGVGDTVGQSTAQFLGVAAVATQNAIDITGPTTDNITIQDCDISWYRNHGIYGHTDTVSGVRIVGNNIHIGRGDGVNLVHAVGISIGNATEISNNIIMQNAGWGITWGAYGSNIIGNLIERNEAGGIQITMTSGAITTLGPVKISGNYFEVETTIADPQPESCITFNIPVGHYVQGVDISGNFLYVGSGALPATNTTWRAFIYAKGGGGIVNGQIGPDFFLADSLAYVDVLTADGTFTAATGWTVGSGWTISGGKATHTALGGVTALEGTTTVTEYQYYRVGLTISSRTAGSLLVYIGTKAESLTYSTDGTYYAYIQAQSGESNAKVKFVPTSDFDGSLDDVTVVQGPVYVDLNDQGYQGLIISPVYPTGNGGRWAHNLSSASVFAGVDSSITGTHRGYDTVPATKGVREYLDQYAVDKRGQTSAGVDYTLSPGATQPYGVGSIQVDTSTDLPELTPYMANAHWFYAGAASVTTGQTLNASTTDITVTGGGGNILKNDRVRVSLADGTYFTFTADTGSTAANLKVATGTTTGSGTTNAASAYWWSRWSPVIVGSHDLTGNPYVYLKEKYLKITGAEGGDATLQLWADQGDDNADKWSIVSQASTNNLSFQNNGTESVRIDSTGGIMATNYVSVLGVEGASASLYMASDEGDDATDSWIIRVEESGNNMVWYNNATPIASLTPTGNLTSVYSSITSGTLDAGAKALDMSYTMDSSAGAENIGSLIAVTSAGTESQTQTPLKMTITGGYTGSSSFRAFRIENLSASSGNAIASTGMIGNVAGNFLSTGVGALNVGNNGVAANGTAINIGVLGCGGDTEASQVNYGVRGIAKSTGAGGIAYGGHFSIDATSGDTTNSAVLVADNLTAEVNILDLRHNGSSVFKVDHTGVITGIKAGDLPAASDSAQGAVELATSAETTTGTDTGRAVTPDGLAGSDFGKRIVEIMVVAPTTDVSATDGQAYFVVPTELNGYDLVRVAATVITAGSTNSTVIDIYSVTQSHDVLSTGMNIETNETSTRTSATPGTIDTTYHNMSTGEVLRIDVTSVSTTKPKGLIVEMVFQLP